MDDSSSAGFQANLQRAELLREQGRYPEAEKYAQAAIAARATDPDGYYELAFCYTNWPDHSTQGLAAVDRAIALDPARSEFFALRAWLLGTLDRDKEAVAVAARALELNPYSILALNAQARAYNGLSDWPLSEACARRALELHAQNELATNLLALALRQQGRLAESEAVTAALLGHAPDNAMAQGNAGWSALQAGDHRRANRHFLEALRLDPNYDDARRGLLHAFNSRVWIYRLYFRFIAWLGRHRRESRIFFLILLYVGYRFVLTELRTQFGREGVHWGYVVVALYLVIFGFGRSFGNFFLLFDRFARHALTRKEKGWSFLAASLYGLIVAGLVGTHAWPQVAALAIIPASFLWAVLYPRVQELFSPRRQA